MYVTSCDSSTGLTNALFCPSDHYTVQKYSMCVLIQGLQTPLMLSTIFGDADIFDLLMARGADVRKTDQVSFISDLEIV